MSRISKHYEAGPDGNLREVTVVTPSAPDRELQRVTQVSGLDFNTLEVAQALRQQVWDPEGLSMNPLYRAVELGGEAGELLNVVKKLQRKLLGLRGSTDTIAHLRQELADVVICTSLLAMCYKIDLGSAVTETFNRKSDEVGIPVFLNDSV